MAPLDKTGVWGVSYLGYTDRMLGVLVTKIEGFVVSFGSGVYRRIVDYTDQRLAPCRCKGEEIGEIGGGYYLLG